MSPSRPLRAGRARRAWCTAGAVACVFAGPHDRHPLAQSDPGGSATAVVRLPIALRAGGAWSEVPTAAPSRTTRASTPTVGASTATPSETPAAPTAVPSPTLRTGCREGLRDPGFEDRTAWALSSDAERPLQQSEAARTGALGLRLGGGDGVDSARAVDAVELKDAGTAVLSFWWRRASAEDAAGPPGDRLIVAVMGDVDEAIEPLLAVADVDRPPDGFDANGWARLTADVTEGFRIREDFARASLMFVAVPDGDDRVTVFDIDDAQLEVCP